MGATQALKDQVGLTKKPITFQEMLESMKPQIAVALPRFLNADRMVRIALTSLRLNPKLAECTPESLLASIMISSQLGLEPGVLGQAYLVPYFNKTLKKHICQLIPGWMGYLDLVNRTGKSSAWTGAVYAGDQFDWALGDRPFVTHKPCGDEARLTHVYAIARTMNSQWPIIEVWTVEKIWNHRNKINKVGDAHYSYQWPEQYARKVPLLQVLKYVPRSVELATALSLEAAAETGGQSFGIKDVPSIIEGSVVPEAEPETPEPRPPQREMCGNCEEFDGNHKPDCKHAQKTPAAQPSPEPAQTPTQTVEAPEKPAHIKAVVKVTKITEKSREQGGKKQKYLVLDVVTNEGEWALYIWDTKLFEQAVTLGSKMVLIEYSQKENKGRTYCSLEAILEVQGETKDEEF